jgi:hypothetical protein
MVALRGDTAAGDRAWARYGQPAAAAALAFVQAVKEGVPPEAVQADQRQSLLLSLERAMAAEGLEAGLGAQHVKPLVHRAGRIARRLVNRSSGKVAVRTITIWLVLATR